MKKEAAAQELLALPERQKGPTSPGAASKSGKAHSVGGAGDSDFSRDPEEDGSRSQAALEASTKEEAIQVTLDPAA